MSSTLSNFISSLNNSNHIGNGSSFSLTGGAAITNTPGLTESMRALSSRNENSYTLINK